MLGIREPSLYGSRTLSDLEQMLHQHAEQKRCIVSCYQSNSEEKLIERIQQACTEQVHGIIINAGAYTHTSIALRDAAAMVSCPFVEVHLSNVYAREVFREQSFLSDKAEAVISGLGFLGYRAAFDFLVDCK